MHLFEFKLAARFSTKIFHSVRFGAAIQYETQILSGNAGGTQCMHVAPLRCTKTSNRTRLFVGTFRNSLWLVTTLFDIRQPIARKILGNAQLVISLLPESAMTRNDIGRYPTANLTKDSGECLVAIGLLPKSAIFALGWHRLAVSGQYFMHSVQVSCTGIPNRTRSANECALSAHSVQRTESPITSWVEHSVTYSATSVIVTRRGWWLTK